MSRLSVRNARENCPWLVLAASFLIAFSTITSTLLWPAESRAFDPANDVPIDFLPDSYSSPQHCRECHEDQFRAWSNTTHAQASFDPIFRVSLQRVAEPGECFACHTTGYDSTTGRFILAGVTCEACHGPFRPDHPEQSTAVAASEDLCGMCHTGTLAEWASSYHRKAGVTCADCHEVHTQKTRSFEVANTLCAGCHQDQIQDATHTVHNHILTGVYCIDCHLARPSGDASDKVKGQIPTGHSFVVALTTCSDCHTSPPPADIESP